MTALQDTGSSDSESMERERMLGDDTQSTFSPLCVGETPSHVQPLARFSGSCLELASNIF